MSWKILVVDSDASVRELLVEYLRTFGHVVRSATDGPEALRMLDLENVDVVIAEVRLPRMSGLDLTQVVRRKEPGLPVLLVAQKPSIDDAVEAMRSGAADYVRKPFRPSEMLARVERALAP